MCELTGMEHTVRRFRFRVRGRGVVVECDARIVDSPGDERLLQAWLSTPEHPHLLLEVGPVHTDAAAFTLFRQLCAHRELEPLEARAYGPRGPGEWGPFPEAASTETTPAIEAKKKTRK